MVRSPVFDRFAAQSIDNTLGISKSGSVKPRVDQCAGDKTNAEERKICFNKSTHAVQVCISALHYKKLKSCLKSEESSDDRNGYKNVLFGAPLYGKTKHYKERLPRAWGNSEAEE